MNPEVDFFFNDDSQWQQEYKKLRKILLNSELVEELKWGVPCYTIQSANVVLIHGFKKYCALLFHKGALLKDATGILIQQTENVQAARQIRLTSVREITDQESLLKAYISEAIDVEKSGLKVEFKKSAEFTIADEFKLRLDELPKLTAAFNALTPGRQRAYLLYFSAPKQSKTRISRVEKYLQKILDGKGLDD